MWACFAGDNGFKDVDFENFDAATWDAAADRYYAEHGVEPHPVVVAQEVREAMGLKCPQSKVPAGG